MEIKYLILGHPRCGTGYSSQLFKSYGIDIGHEQMGQDGISCWQYVIKDDIPKFSKKNLKNKNRNNHNFNKIIHTVRDPMSALPSIYHTETPKGANPKHWAYKFMIESHNWRKKKLKLSDDNIFEFVAQSFIKWNKLIEKDTPDFILKIESPHNIITYFENELNLKKIKEADTSYNSRKYDNKFKWEKVTKETLELLDKFCDKYNYKKISERI